MSRHARLQKTMRSPVRQARAGHNRAHRIARGDDTALASRVRGHEASSAGGLNEHAEYIRLIRKIPGKLRFW